MITANKSILNTLNLSSDTESQFQDTEEDFKTGYALIIISIAILIGNSLVLLTVKSFARRLVADIFISSLALLDLIHILTSILLAIIFKWTLLHRKKSSESKFRVLCQIQAWFTVTTQIQSAFIVTLINLERLTAVSRPFFYKSYVSTRGAVKILLVLLFVSICISSFPLIGGENYELLPRMALCLFPQDSNYAIFIVVIGYADLLVVSYCFFAIKISLKKFMKRQARFVARRGAIIELQSRGVDSALKITKTASKSIIQSQRLLKITAMVSGLFYFSWLPLMVAITIVQVTHKPNYVLSLIATLQPLAGPLANPFIYFFSWERYKKSYIKIVQTLMSCLVTFDDTTIFDQASNPAIIRSMENLDHSNQNEDEGNTKKQPLNKTLPETSVSHAIPQAKNLPMMDGKLRSCSYDTMATKCLTSTIKVPCPYTETKRRNIIGETSGNDIVEREPDMKYNSQKSSSTSKDETINCNRSRNNEDLCPKKILTEGFGLDINKHKSQHKNSFSIGKLKKDSRKLSTSWFKTSQESFETNQNENPKDERFKVNHGEKIVKHDEVSVKEGSTLNNHVPQSSVTRNTEHASENLAKCLITQRISQYLTNVMSERELQTSHKSCKGSGKQQEKTKKRHSVSRNNSPKIYKYSASKYAARKNASRQSPKQLHSKKKLKYSRKHYWEEFEDFRKQLDGDQMERKCVQPKEMLKLSENLDKDTASSKPEDQQHFQESFKRETTMTFENHSAIVRTLPIMTSSAARKNKMAPLFLHVYRRNENSTGSHHQVFLADALRKKNSKKQLGLQRDAASNH